MKNGRQDRIAETLTSVEISYERMMKNLCKRLRDSILSPVFHSYIFAMYKNESLWI